MILYFSGTGNSRYLSEVINQVLDDEVVCLNEYLKNNRHGHFVSQRPYVFVLPTYAWKIPQVIKELIEQSTFEKNRKVYFILTCGSGIGNAASEIKTIVAKKGLSYQGVAKVLMPENFIVMFKAPNHEVAKKIINNGKNEALRLANQILKGLAFDNKSIGIFGHLASGIVNQTFYRFLMTDRGFWVNEKCTGCGKCVKLCPMNNIELVGKPKWHGNCTWCMACINGCALQAIEYKRKTIHKQRYFLTEHYREDIKCE